MRILLVDDNPVDRAIIAKMIEAAGHEVITAASGQAAIASAALTDFDLILLDHRMPDMDGIETTRRIRAMGGPRGLVPIVALSGLRLGNEVYRDAGVDHYLSKDGVSVERIVKAVADGVAAGRDRDLPNEAAADISEFRESFRIPRVIAFTVMLGMPAMIGTGAWYMAIQAADARYLADTQAKDAARLATDLVAARATVAAELAAQSAITRQNSEALSRLDHDQSEVIARIDLRLTRLEAQMNFLIGTNSPARKP